MRFFRTYQVSFVERVDDTDYEHVIPDSEGLTWFRVGRHASRDSLTLSLWSEHVENVPEITALVRKMLDLDVEPHNIRTY